MTDNPDLLPVFMEELLQHVRKAVLYDSPKKYLGMELKFLPDKKVMVHHTNYIEEHFSDMIKKSPTP